MQYRPFKSKIIVEQVQALLNNVWMEKCGVPRGSIIVLASKPHQENILNIDDFIWRMCVYYRKLNSITNTFEFPILPCDGDISTVGAGSNKIWIISLDARQLYYQISVCHVDRENYLSSYHINKNIRSLLFHSVPLTPLFLFSYYEEL